VRESIESRVQAFGLKDKVGRVMIPTEPVTEIVNGKSAPWNGLPTRLCAGGDGAG